MWMQIPWQYVDYNWGETSEFTTRVLAPLMFESTENISAIEDFVFLTHLGELFEKEPKVTAWTNQWYILNK